MDHVIKTLEGELDRTGEITPCQAFTALFNLRKTDAKRWAFAFFLVGLITALALVAAIVLACGGGAPRFKRKLMSFLRK
jgi:hypothetical protein